MKNTYRLTSSKRRIYLTSRDSLKSLSRVNILTSFRILNPLDAFTMAVLRSVLSIMRNTYSRGKEEHRSKKNQPFKYLLRMTRLSNIVCKERVRVRLAMINKSKGKISNE